MRLIDCYIIVLSILFVFSNSAESAERAIPESIPKTIKLTTTDWCPYSCSNEQSRGIVYDYLTHIFSEQGAVLEVMQLPWSRAIVEANRGTDIHGLLTAVEAEAPELELTKAPIMPYQVCFFGSSENQWRYMDSDSLNDFDQTLAAIQDYSYGEPVDSFIKENKVFGKVTLLGGDNSLERLVQLLELNRIDIFVEERNVALHKISKINTSVNITNLGCLEAIPFYLAINPGLPWASDLLSWLDEQLRLEQNLELLKVLTQSYIEQK